MNQRDAYEMAGDFLESFENMMGKIYKELYLIRIALAATALKDSMRSVNGQLEPVVDDLFKLLELE